MAEAPLWAILLVPIIVGGLALAAASFDAGLQTVAAGRRVGAADLAIPLHETARLLIRQRRTTVAPDALVWRLGGGGLLVVALLMAVDIPVGGVIISDLTVGALWFNTMEAVLWAALWLAGWGANSAFSLVGGYRFLAQGLAYQLPMMFAIVTAAIPAKSLRMSAIVAAQTGLWSAVWMPVAFVIFLVTVLALSFWGPFAHPAGPDIAGGLTVELAGVDRLVLLAGRYALLASSAGFTTAIFLGGGAGPLLPGWLWSLAKTLAVLGLLVWLRGRAPIVRMERFEEIAWLVLIPIVLLQMLVVAVVVFVVR
jgi:NADH-quinone oxidoreductase subunit H